MTSAVGFKPNKGYVLLALPKDFSKTILELQNDVLEERRADYIKQGNPLTVVEVHPDLDFVSPGEKILVTSHAKLQKVEVEEHDEPFYAIREPDILGKFD